MRVTFDSNAWQQVILPNRARKTGLYDSFTTVHEALRTKQILGFICETVGTLEAITSARRKEYLTSIKPIVEVKADTQGSQLLATINISASHDQHPGLPRVLRERLERVRARYAPRASAPHRDAHSCSVLGFVSFRRRVRCSHLTQAYDVRFATISELAEIAASFTTQISPEPTRQGS